MNVFVVPSWYPGHANPITGIFFREQATAMASQYPDINIGISTWGQNDERLLLWSGKPVSSLSKLFRKPKAKITKLGKNIAEYMTPAYTWSSRLMDGNMNNIIAANASNFEKFTSDFEKPDIIHAHVAFPAGFIARKLSQTYDIPYIITEHMSPFPHQQFLSSPGILNRELSMAYRDATANVCVSQSLERKMNSFGIENTVVVPNLVDEDFFIPYFQQKQNEQFTFFSLGRMVPQKGIDNLLVAFSKANNTAQLRIGGDGAFLKQYKKLSQDLKIADRVTWLGPLKKNAALSEFQNCDAFVLPSRHESMGLVFVEAMSCGKPVIATICGGPEEFVNEDCGYLVAKEHEVKLLNAMRSIIANYQQFNGKTIRKYFESRFSKAVVCKMIYEEYYKAIEALNSTR